MEGFEGLSDYEIGEEQHQRRLNDPRELTEAPPRLREIEDIEVQLPGRGPAPHSSSITPNPSVASIDTLQCQMEQLLLSSGVDASTFNRNLIDNYVAIREHNPSAVDPDGDSVGNEANAS